MSDRVFVRDPANPDRNGYVTQRAYDALWSKKGYEIVQPEAGAPAPDPDLEALNEELDEKTQLRGILDERGVSFDGRMGVKRLRQLVEETA